MASEPDGKVGTCADAFGGEITFFTVQDRVTIDTSGLALVLDAPQREEFQRLFMEAERCAEAWAASHG